jgi:hypothetical protein
MKTITKTAVACTAMAAALLGFGTIAMAADDAMMAKPMTHMATMVCRPADAGEKATAMMGAKALVCKTVDMKEVMAMKKTVEAMPQGEPLWLKMLNEYQVGPSNS